MSIGKRYGCAFCGQRKHRSSCLLHSAPAAAFACRVGVGLYIKTLQWLLCMFLLLTLAAVSVALRNGSALRVLWVLRVPVSPCRCPS
jgi:hypothetical protein